MDESKLRNHLRATSPALASCSSCGRKTWLVDELGTLCQMLGSKGTRCPGRFLSKDTPRDYASPDWLAAQRVHDWRNYISERLQKSWHTFNDQQKQAIAESAEAAAAREEWHHDLRSLVGVSELLGRHG
jgi:hypothetical protein